MVKKVKYTLNLIMDTKEVKIECPEGYEIDKENSTFDCIKFKVKSIKRWRDENPIVNGYCVVWDIAYPFSNLPWKDGNLNTFATEKQAKSALAMAQISQIMANDKRFGGVVTDEEWEDTDLDKYVILRNNLNTTCNGIACYNYSFLAFHTTEQRDLFLKENEDLVKDYLMID